MRQASPAPVDDGLDTSPFSFSSRKIVVTERDRRAGHDVWMDVHLHLRAGEMRLRNADAEQRYRDLAGDAVDLLGGHAGQAVHDEIGARLGNATPRRITASGSSATVRPMMTKSRSDARVDRRLKPFTHLLDRLQLGSRRPAGSGPGLHFLRVAAVLDVEAPRFLPARIAAPSGRRSATSRRPGRHRQSPEWTLHAQCGPQCPPCRVVVMMPQSGTPRYVIDIMLPPM